MKNLLLLALFAVTIVGCSSPTEAPKTETATSSAAPTETATPVGFKGEDGKLQCIVKKTPIASESAAVAFSDHDGVRYYFCCKDCKAKYDADPHQFVKH